VSSTTTEYLSTSQSATKFESPTVVVGDIYIVADCDVDRDSVVVGDTDIVADCDVDRCSVVVEDADIVAD
jgi:hypothetical protein